MKLSKESWGVVLFTTLFTTITVAGVLAIRDNMTNGFKFTK